jgi:hypothetical protein
MDPKASADSQKKPRPDMIEQIKELTNRRLKVSVLLGMHPLFRNQRKSC